MEVSELGYLRHEAALEGFIESFESGTFPGAEWKHAEHVVLAACYLYTMSLTQAVDRARDRIRAYNESQGGKNTEDSGYHETLTVFWMRLIDVELNRAAGRVQAAREIVERFGHQRDLYRDYYSFDVVKSREARRQWVPPDRRGLASVAGSALDLIQT